MNTPQKGWALLTRAAKDGSDLPPVLTVTQIMTITHLARTTVREMLVSYDVPHLPRYGRRDTIRYPRQDVIDAISRMVGSGRSKTKKSG
jgi:hypothetical protein